MLVFFVENQAMDQQAFFKALRSRIPSMKTGAEIADVNAIPTGITLLDHLVIGCGGIPIGRMVELAAEEGAGKSSVGYSFLGSAQTLDYNAAFIDGERRLNLSRAQDFGVDPSGVVIFKPPHFEGMLEELDHALPVFKASGVPTALVLDSIAAIPTREEYDNGLSPGQIEKGKNKGKTRNETVAARARILSRAIRVLAQKIEDADVALLVINQLRTNINSGGFGSSDFYTTGGKALAYYAATRIWMSTGEKIEKRGVRVGKSPKVWTTKNLFGPPTPPNTRLCLDFDQGWDNDRSLCILGKDIGILPEGAHVTDKNAAEVLRVMELANWSPLGAAEIVEAERAKAEAEKPKKKKRAKKGSK